MKASERARLANTPPWQKKEKKKEIDLRRYLATVDGELVTFFLKDGVITTEKYNGKFLLEYVEETNPVLAERIKKYFEENK